MSTNLQALLTIATRLRHALLLLFLVTLQLAAHAEQGSSALERELAAEQRGSATVELDGRELFRVSGTAIVPADKRAAVINARLLAVARDYTIAPESLQVREEDDLTRIVAGDPAILGRVYTDLHRNILDVFNEYGVQIMTPAYEGDPESPKLVPRAHWFQDPASAAEETRYPQDSHRHLSA